MTAPTLQAIPNYDKYFLKHDVKLNGFSDDGLVPIKVQDIDENEVKLSAFFRIDDIIYLSISSIENTGTEEEPVSEAVTYFYQQEDGNIENIEELPEKPEQDYSVYKSNNFEIVQADYQGEPISKAFNLYFKGSAVFKQISGFYEIATGLFFNVLQSVLPGKPEALYFFPIKRTSVSKIAEKGEVW